jgi:hypothetical protein
MLHWARIEGKEILAEFWWKYILKNKSCLATDVRAEDNIQTEREIVRMRNGRNNSGHQ